MLLEFTGSITTRDITFTITQDEVLEFSEVFQVILSDPQPMNRVQINPGVADVTIEDSNSKSIITCSSLASTIWPVILSEFLSVCVYVSHPLCMCNYVINLAPRRGEVIVIVVCECVCVCVLPLKRAQRVPNATY